MRSIECLEEAIKMELQGNKNAVEKLLESAMEVEKIETEENLQLKNADKNVLENNNNAIKNESGKSSETCNKTISTHVKKQDAEKMLNEAGVFYIEGGESVSVRIQGKWCSILSLSKEIEKLLQQYVNQYCILNRTLHYNHIDKKKRDVLDFTRGRVYYSLYKRVGHAE